MKKLTQSSERKIGAVLSYVQIFTGAITGLLMIFCKCKEKGIITVWYPL